MAKVKTTQFEEQLIRYMLVSEGDGTTNLWFFSSDILMILPNTLSNVFPEDIKEISYKDGEDIRKTVAINIYGVFHLISLALLKPDRDKALKFKKMLTLEILPRINKEFNNPLSEEDKLYLKIIHSETNSEKAYCLSEVNKLKNKQKNLETYKEAVVKNPTSNKVYFISDINERFGFKTGQLTNWLRAKGFFQYGGSSGKSPQVLYPGSEFLAIYQGGKNNVNGCASRSKLCVTPKGIEMITEKQEEIRKAKRQCNR